MPKNTAQCPWPGLEHGPLAPGMSALTMRLATTQPCTKEEIEVLENAKDPKIKKIIFSMSLTVSCKGLCNNYLEGGSKINRGGLNLNQSAG